MSKSLRSTIPAPIKRAIRSQLQARLGSGYQWQMAPSIQEQTFRFVVADRSLTVEADARTPVYETIHEVADYDCYQLDRLSAPLDGCVIDVGGNIGITALALHARFGLPVYSFEPMPDNVVRLRQNVELNGLQSSIHIIDAAIGGRTGSVLADVTWEASVSARVGADLRAAADAPTTPVRMVSLQDALASVNESVFLIKLDCEGAEFEIIDQLTPGLAKDIPNLTFEIHDQGPDRNVRTITRQLESLGYSVRPKSEMRGRSTMHHVLATRR
jgi:FkbM family methyltransferase